MTQTSVVDALLGGYYADADALLERGVASEADIDLAMRWGAGYPAGPFEARGRGIAAAPTPPPRTEPSGWRRAAVIGCGHMATGIAEALARAAVSVVVVGRTPESIARAEATIAARRDRALSRGRISSAEAAALDARIDYVTDLSRAPVVDLVVEAVVEDLDVKRRVFAELDAALPAGVVFATNTSSFRVAEVMAHTRAERVALALHFFNPAVAMKLVEVIPAPGHDDVVDRGRGFVDEIGKVAVRSADTRGFIVNRLLIPFLNDAVRLHERGAAVADIDRAMTDEAGLPMGPLALIDLIGVDVTVAALESMAAESGDPRLRPAATLYRFIDDGRLGQKSGGGFHQRRETT